MQKIKLTLTLLLVTLVSAIGFAQDAKALLDEVSAKVRSYDNIYIEFRYNLNNTKENVNQDARGDVTISGENYVLNMLGTTSIFDGTNSYVIVPEDEEVTISPYNPEDEKSVTPSRMLTFYEKGYRYQNDITQNVKGRKIQFVKLMPIDNQAEIKDILLGIDVQTKHVYKLIQTDDNGTKFTLTVQNFKTNQPISETLFSFNEEKYEEMGYYINRLD
ncbi:LolA family protein [Aureitalea marina]|uniref:Gliding motility protein n=1 Tax=Aureitalea marina TaxID=930804 RepID=A0A2S7KTJ0_9FLAO|nr:outer membrane lipoprotein carrier protein LolA [Aureitalea marina]PQB05947.1 hypothetical protein BST85_03875 [Aureitalea marina]